MQKRDFKTSVSGDSHGDFSSPNTPKARSNSTLELSSTSRINTARSGVNGPSVIDKQSSSSASSSEDSSHEEINVEVNVSGSNQHSGINNEVQFKVGSDANNNVSNENSAHNESESNSPSSSSEESSSSSDSEQSGSNNSNESYDKTDSS